MDPWIMKQKWHHVFFLHWAVPAASLRPHVPGQLELDLAEGSACLGWSASNHPEHGPVFLLRFPERAHSWN